MTPSVGRSRLINSMEWNMNVKALVTTAATVLAVLFIVNRVPQLKQIVG